MLRFFCFFFFCLLAFPSLFARGKGEPCFSPEANGAAADTVGDVQRWNLQGSIPRASDIAVRYVPDTLRIGEERRGAEAWWEVDFSPYGLIPRWKKKKEERWRNIPEDCRIVWRRHREHFVWDLLNDVSTLFNTVDTTYVQRNRYAGQIQLYNTHFLQLIRLRGTDAEGKSQALTFSPAHTVKIGPYISWHGLTLGYSFGVVPDHYGSHSSEWTVAAYNSKVGFDFSYVSSKGNFNLLSVSGIEGVDNAQIRNVRFQAMHTHTLAVNAYYVFNYRHFSYPAAFSLSTVQLRSAGSWLLGARYDNQALHFDAQKTEAFFKTISPQAQLNEALRIDKIKYRQFAVSLGYAYNWVPWRGWLLCASAAPALGYKYQRGETFSTQTLRRNIENFQFDCIFRLGLVRTNGIYYAGLSTVSYLYDYRLDNFRLLNSIHYIQLYVGFNFSRLPLFRGERRGAANTLY